MKNILIAILTIATLVGFGGCKKGENDPGISFRSRDARAVGEWKMSSGEMVTSSESGSATKTTSSNTVKFDGSKIASTNVVNGAVQPSTQDLNTYEITLKMEKDGTIEYMEKATDPQGIVSTFIVNGTWSWVDSRKNKSMLTIAYTPQNPSGHVLDPGTYMVDQLKNDEIILKMSNESTSTTTGQASNGNLVSKFNATITLTQ